jgi:hypothetical protein
MSRGLASGTLLALLCFASTGVAAESDKEAPMRRIGREELCVTNGVVSSLPDGSLAIDAPSSRAVVRVSTDQRAELRFRYLGPTAVSKPLASGELRRQIGLKLRAQDSCNLVYAMWHIEPDTKFAVSIKRNPDQHTHAQCHAQGYVTMRARRSVALPGIRPGESHSFRAALQGTDLTLVADGSVVWEGTLGSEILTFDGPVGFRTDNARFEFAYYAANPGPGIDPNGSDARVTKCSTGPED